MQRHVTPSLSRDKLLLIISSLHVGHFIDVGRNPCAFIQLTQLSFVKQIIVTI